MRIVKTISIDSRYYDYLLKTNRGKGFTNIVKEALSFYYGLESDDEIKKIYSEITMISKEIKRLSNKQENLEKYLKILRGDIK